MKKVSVADDAFELIANWAVAAETDWTNVAPPAVPAALSAAGRFGCYGTGYDGWGVQTQQKYLATLAAVATLGAKRGHAASDHALARALAALRFNLASHKSGTCTCTDGSRWGHSWISALGIERMMFGVQLLMPHMDESDHADLRRVLCSEADWLLNSYYRQEGITGVHAGMWNKSGKNDPESNIWNGSLLWRTAMMYPDDPRAADWQERAHMFLINGVSIESDAEDHRIVAGKPVSERHVGANFFPNYALDHHGYLNVGYMVICLSNAAMLHLDMSAAGLQRPESLYLHQQDLWQVTRQMIFDDGRLARIGGDTRVRYAYCQEYLLPARLFAAECLSDPHALDGVPAQLDCIRTEARAGGDGYFYGERLAALRKVSPLYYTRLESDRACALAMLATYWERAAAVSDASPQKEQLAPAHVGGSASGVNWEEPLHAAAMHRCPTRFASFAWRAADLAQGLCLPPERGDLAEWEYNLCGHIAFCHHPHPMHGVTEPRRRFNDAAVTSFDGGFVTCGSVYEGVNLRLAESWRGTDSALHHVAFAALPDGHTVVALQYCQMGGRRGYVAHISGLHLNLPADILSPGSRSLATAGGELLLQNPPAADQLQKLEGNWACAEGAVSVVGLYGADALWLDRSSHRRGGKLDSLFVDRLLWPRREGPLRFEAGEVILDSGWAALSSVSAAQTRHFAEANASAQLTALHLCASGSIGDGTEDSEAACGPILRGVKVKAMDGICYLLLSNFGSVAATVSVAQLLQHDGSGDDQALSPSRTLTCLATGDVFRSELPLLPAQARLLMVKA